jgi:hypothetical protein
MKLGKLLGDAGDGLNASQGSLLDGPISLLDVGSITNPWTGLESVDATCIDPHPHPQHGRHVVPQHMLDYFDSWQRAGQGRFDCVALCMVLNCEGDPLNR